MSLGFAGFVAYATVRTTPPASIVETTEGAEEQMLAGAASADVADAGAPEVQLYEQQASMSAEAFSAQSEAATPTPAVISPPTEVQTQPDEPARPSHYEDDDEDDEDEDDD